MGHLLKNGTDLIIQYICILESENRSFLRYIAEGYKSQ